MICLEANEYQNGRNSFKYMPEDILKPYDFRVIRGLEAATGADAMICPSPFPLPFSEDSIRHQMEKGAKLIQLKYGQDLTASITDGRLKESIHRMNQWTPNGWQKILLFIGSYSIDRKKGMAKVNGQTSRVTYSTLESSMIFWQLRGGALDFPLPRYDMILTRLLKHEYSLSIEARKYFYSQDKIYQKPKQSSIDNDLFQEAYQELIEIKDMRKTLISLPGLGEDKVQTIWAAMEDKSILTFIDMLMEGKLRELKGIGAGTENKIKGYLGIT